jgi:hypothetical protein
MTWSIYDTGSDKYCWLCVKKNENTLVCDRKEYQTVIVVTRNKLQGASK